MKKLLLLILMLAWVLSAASCVETCIEETTTGDIKNIPTQETTSQSEDTSDTEETTLDTSETETTVEETTMSPEQRYELGMSYVRCYEAYIVTGGEEYAPYTSTVWFQNPYMTGDGVLMFVSMENQLPHWIEDDVIPHIALAADADVRFEYHEETELQYSGKFKLYLQDENGVVTKVKEFENADLAEVYAYGKENLAGKTVYISYPFLLRYGDYGYLSDAMWGDHAAHDIMCIFATTF